MPSDPKPSRIMVTGASGFVGSWLLRALRGRAEKVPLEIYPLPAEKTVDLPFELTSEESVIAAVEYVRPTAVIHLAAIAAPAQAKENPRHAFEVNVIGTLNLARAVLATVPDARFVFVGSSEAYGSSFNETSTPLKEDAPFKPTSSYGVTKAAADVLIGQMAYEGLRSIRFRPFNHTGPGQMAAYVASALAKQVARIEAGHQPPVLRVGNLDAERDFLDVRDVVAAYAAAALEGDNIEPGTAINLATGRPWSIRNVLEQLIGNSGEAIDVKVDPGRVRPNDIPRVTGDAGLASRLLDWQPRIPFEQTLSDLLDYWRMREGGL